MKICRQIPPVVKLKKSEKMIGSKKLFTAALIFLTLIFLLFSCRNISPDDLQKDDLKQIMDFLFEDKNKTEPYIELTYENTENSSETTEAANLIPLAAETNTTQGKNDGDYTSSSEETELPARETEEATAETLKPDKRVIKEYPDIPDQFSYIPLPVSLSFTDNIKNMISNLNGLAKRDFNTQRVYIATSKPELLTPNLQNNKSGDAKYYRNKLIEQKYNINLNSLYIKNEEDSIYPDISKSIDSGEYFSDILCLPMNETLKLLYSGRLYNLRKTPFINFNAPYYNQSLISDSQIKNSLYMLSSDFTFDPNELYVLYLNRDLCKEKLADLKIDDYIETDEWTLDILLTMFKIFNDNINIPSSEDEEPPEDFFAADFNDDNILRSFFTSGGIKYFSRAENYPALNFNTPEDYNIIENLKSLLQGYLTAFPSEEEPSPVEKFTSGNALFLISTLEHINSFTALPFEWTLLPFPKSDSNNNYAGYPSQDSLVISIPGSVSNTELCGIMIEALSISSYNLLNEEYVNEKMIYNLRDIESVKTLKEITPLNKINYTNTFPLNLPSFGGSENIYNPTAGYIKNIITEEIDYSSFSDGSVNSQSLLEGFFNLIGRNNNIY